MAVLWQLGVQFIQGYFVNAPEEVVMAEGTSAPLSPAARTACRGTRASIGPPLRPESLRCPSMALLTFCAVYALAVATPGPGIAAIIARSLAHGFKGAPAFIARLHRRRPRLVRDRGHRPRGAREDRRDAVRRHQVGRRRLSTVPGVETVDRAGRARRGRRPIERQHGWRAFVASLDAHAGEPEGHPVLPRAAADGRRSRVDEPGAFLEISAAMCVVQPLVLVSYVFLAARARELFTTPKPCGA